MRDTIIKVGPRNMVPIITNYAVVCKAIGMFVELKFPSIYCAPCVMHATNLALKNICANQKKFVVATFIKIFIVGALLIRFQ